MKSDLELMADFRNGDRPAFHKLIRRHHVAILNFFHPLTGSQTVAEELTQSVFLRIFGELEHQAESTLWGRGRDENAHPFSTFSTYLYRTGYVCWLEHLRREGLPRALPCATPTTATANVSEIQAPFVPAPDAPPNSFTLLTALPNDLKPVVVLCEINRLGYAEIAAVLNVSTGTVRARMREAFALLRAARRENAAAPAKPPADSAVRPGPEVPPLKQG